MKKVIIAFVPVLQEGYRRFLEKHQTADGLFILGDELAGLAPQLAKEIRALPPELIKISLEAWPEIKMPIEILDEKRLMALAEDPGIEIVMPDEDISRELRQKYLSESLVTYDQVFLRWDKHSTVAEKPVNSDVKISAAEFDKKMMALAEDEAQKSSDWWRRIGAVIVQDGQLILSEHNHHVPSDHMPNINGDPRSNFHKGDHLELSTAIHAEAAAIAEAARRGVSLQGAEIYSTTFPCPPCAKLIAYSGIKKIYYRIGYGVLDGESILKSRGVEILFVEE